MPGGIRERPDRHSPPLVARHGRYYAQILRSACAALEPSPHNFSRPGVSARNTPKRPQPGPSGRRHLPHRSAPGTGCRGPGRRRAGRPEAEARRFPIGTLRRTQYAQETRERLERRSFPFVRPLCRKTHEQERFESKPPSLERVRARVHHPGAIRSQPNSGPARLRRSLR